MMFDAVKCRRRRFPLVFALIVMGSLLLVHFGVVGPPVVSLSLPAELRQTGSLPKSTCDARDQSGILKLRSFDRAGYRPRTLLPQPPLFEDRSSTHLDCRGSMDDNRTCWASNVCFNLNAESWPRYPLEMWTGAASQPCVQIPSLSGTQVCDFQKHVNFLFLGTVRSSQCNFQPTVRAAAIPADLVAAWVDHPIFVLNRHYPGNYAHAVCDDMFPIFHYMKHWLDWSEDSAYAWTAQGRPPLMTTPFSAIESSPGRSINGTPSEGVPVKSRSHPLGLLYIDWQHPVEDVHRGGITLAAKLTGRLFPNVEIINPAGWKTQYGASPSKPLVCFRRALMGAPGMSLMRNGGYSMNAARRWRDADLDVPRFLADESAFVAHMVATFAPEHRSRESAVAAMSGKRGTVVLLQRDSKRVIRNYDAMWQSIQGVAGGRSLVRHSFSNLSADIHVLQSADIVVGAHGAGSVNLWFLRPGAAWVDLIPPRVTDLSPVMLALAEREGVRFYSQPLVEFDWQTTKMIDNSISAPFFDVDIKAITGLVSIVLGEEP